MISRGCLVRPKSRVSYKTHQSLAIQYIQGTVFLTITEPYVDAVLSEPNPEYTVIDVLSPGSGVVRTLYVDDLEVISEG